MQPNYNEMAEKQQQDYQRSRDPFQYGQQVAQRRYSEIMASLDAQRQSTQQSYSDMYSAARQQAVRGQAAGGPTLSGGMGQQQRDYISAAEMQQLSQIGNQRNTAMRDLFTQGQSAFSNAQLEGQQATQMELQNQQAQLQIVQQRQAIMADTNLSDEQRREQLEALGVSPESVAEKQRTWDQWLATGAIGLGTGAVAIAGIAKVAGAVKLGLAGITSVTAGTSAAAATKLLGFGGIKAAAALGGAGKVGSLIAASMYAHPVGWAIGAIVVGSLLVAGVAGAIKNSQ